MRLIVLASLSLLLVAQTVLACDALWRVLGENPITARLTLTMQEQLRAHPIWKRYAANRDGGAGLAFRFQPFQSSFLEPGEVTLFSKGESIQSHFVAQTLKTLFPRAALYAPTRNTKLTVSFLVLDSGEQEELKSWQVKTGNPNVLEMSVLKSANGRAVEASRDEVRSRLGWPVRSTLVHSYHGNLPHKNNELRPKLLNAFGARDLVVIQTDDSTETYGNEEGLSVFRQATGWQQAHLLSRIERGDLDTPGPHLVINDTLGFVPAISRASDLVVISGPYNLFEGLNAGVPTLFERYTKKSYSPEVFQAMAKTAIASKGAREFSSPVAFGRALADLKKGKFSDSTPPYAIRTGGRSAFERYLDHLMEVLDKNLPLSGARGPSSPQEP